MICNKNQKMSTRAKPSIKSVNDGIPPDDCSVSTGKWLIGLSLKQVNTFHYTSQYKFYTNGFNTQVIELLVFAIMRLVKKFFFQFSLDNYVTQTYQ